MVEMDHSVLGLSAKTHALILAGLFGFFCVLMVGIETWQIPKGAENGYWDTFMNIRLFFLGFFSPITLFLSALGMLCLLKCNAKVIVILCVVWPLGVSITVASFVFQCFTGLYAGMEILEYTIIAGSFVLLIGSVHCIVLLLALAFCARSSGGADVDLYDLEKSDSQEESTSSSEQDKHCIQ
ncbi:hypothetical protein CAEBREN_16375 [Caenorhabditis brenneri]|uniref:Uncharacterized protein n=1 Tax=Caenorhabditis brenneri TaxID=135651 RepID=G0N3N1_CAEBE|nr:hypothetical protein CAEBREN_16375 [Caenorhabditis brenneri]